MSLKKVFDSGNFYNWNSLGERERNKTEFKKNQTLFAKTNLEQSKTNCNFRRDFLVEKNNENVEKYPTTANNSLQPPATHRQVGFYPLLQLSWGSILSPSSQEGWTPNP